MSPVQSAGKDAKSTKDSADSKGDSKDEAVPKKMTRAAAKAGATKVAAVAAEEVPETAATLDKNPSELKSAEENPIGEDSDSKDSKDATKTRPRRAAAKEKILDEAATTEDTLGAVQPESESAGRNPDAKDASVPKDSKDATKSKKPREADKGPSSKGKIQEEATETSDGSTAKLPESAIAGENLAAAASTSSKDLTNVRKTRTATKAESSKGNVPEEVKKVADTSVRSEPTAVEKDSQEDNSSKDTTKTKKARAKVVVVKSDTPVEATETDAGVSSLTKTHSNEGISASKDTDDAKDSKQCQTKSTSTSKKTTGSADEESSGTESRSTEQLIPEKPIEKDKNYRVYIFLSQFRVNDIVVRLVPIERPVEEPVAGPSGPSAPGPSGTSAPGPSGTSAPGPSGTSAPGPSGTSAPGPSGTSASGPCGTAVSGAGTAAYGPSSTAALGPSGTSFSGPSGTSFTVPYATEATGPHGTTASLPRGTATSEPSGTAALEPLKGTGYSKPVLSENYVIVGHYVVIDARHSEHVDEHGYVTRSFSRRINLPRNVIGGELKCYFTGNGILVLEAPLEKTLIDLLTDDAKDSKGSGLIVKTIQPLLA